MKARYWFGLALLAAVVSMVALRANAQHALLLKNQILEKDQAGVDVTHDIATLQQYVFKHMNASTTFTLTASYERAVGDLSGQGITGALYAQAQAACDIVGNTSTVQAHCVEDYLSKHAPNRLRLDLPVASRYQYAFASPNLSFDLAGNSLLAALALLILAVSRYIASLMSSHSS